MLPCSFDVRLHAPEQLRTYNIPRRVLRPSDPSVRLAIEYRIWFLSQSPFNPLRHSCCLELLETENLVYSTQPSPRCRLRYQRGQSRIVSNRQSVGFVHPKTLSGSLVRKPVDVVVDVGSHLEILEFSEKTGTSTVAFGNGCAA